MPMKIILIIIGIILLISIVRDGFANLKANPVQSSTNSIKYIYQQGKGVIQTVSNNTGLTDLGRLPCTTNQSCSILQECGNTCVCQEGNCFKTK